MKLQSNRRDRSAVHVSRILCFERLERREVLTGGPFGDDASDRSSDDQPNGSENSRNGRSEYRARGGPDPSERGRPEHSGKGRPGHGEVDRPEFARGPRHEMTAGEGKNEGGGRAVERDGGRSRSATPPPPQLPGGSNGPGNASQETRAPEASKSTPTPEAPKSTPAPETPKSTPASETPKSTPAPETPISRPTLGTTPSTSVDRTPAATVPQSVSFAGQTSDRGGGAESVGRSRPLVQAGGQVSQLLSGRGVTVADWRIMGAETAGTPWEGAARVDSPLRPSVDGSSRAHLTLASRLQDMRIGSQHDGRIALSRWLDKTLAMREAIDQLEETLQTLADEQRTRAGESIRAEKPDERETASRPDAAIDWFALSQGIVLDQASEDGGVTIPADVLTAALAQADAAAWTIDIAITQAWLVPGGAVLASSSRPPVGSAAGVLAGGVPDAAVDSSQEEAASLSKRSLAGVGSLALAAAVVLQFAKPAKRRMLADQREAMRKLPPSP